LKELGKKGSERGRKRKISSGSKKEKKDVLGIGRKVRQN